MRCTESIRRGDRRQTSRLPFARADEFPGGISASRPGLLLPVPTPHSVDPRPLTRSVKHLKLLLVCTQVGTGTLGASSGKMDGASGAFHVAPEQQHQLDHVGTGGGSASRGTSFLRENF